MGNYKLNNDSFKLFFNKERKVIRGKNRANWWILFTMFLVTILSISFSKSSLSYLDKKMNDPFINWVNVQNRTDAPISKLISKLSNSEKNKELSNRFGFQNVEQNFYRNIIFLNKNNHTMPFEGRTLKPASPILKRILSDENLLYGRDIMNDSKSIGLIVTKDMITALGYEKAPLYINIGYPFDSLKTRLVNDLNLTTNLDYFGTPIPVIAVVKQLPGMMSFLCTEYFIQQKDNQENTFDLTKPEYLNSLEFACEKNSLNKNKLDSFIRSKTNKPFSIDESIETNSYEDYSLLRVNFTKEDSVSAKEIGLRAKEIENKFQSFKIVRICTYNTSNQEIRMQTDYLSLDFHRLDSIQSFAKWANEECGVKIDMTQIDAKNNFNIISRLGNSLSVSIVGISIAFIVIFLINLFRSHFEKVKKNIGTFKAFGLGNKSLISVYMAVLSYIVLTAFLSALLCSVVIELFTILLGILNEGDPILHVLSDITLYSMLVTIFIALVAIYITVNRLLKSTPGDLIYERV